MEEETKERWLQLCHQATTEHDPEKLFQLVHEINALLEEKQARLNQLQAEGNSKPLTKHAAGS